MRVTSCVLIRSRGLVGHKNGSQRADLTLASGGFRRLHQRRLGDQHLSRISMIYANMESLGYVSRGQRNTRP